VTDTAPAAASPGASDGAPAGTAAGPAPDGQAPPQGPPEGRPDQGRPDQDRGQRGDGTESVQAAARHHDEPQPRRQRNPAPAKADAGDPDAAAGDAPEGGEDAWRVEDLPPGAQKVIAKLRAENAKVRTDAKAAGEKAKASDEKFAGAVQAFMTAMGMTPEAEPELTPEQRTSQLTEQLTAATAEHDKTNRALRDARVELAVYRAAGRLGAEPDALLDSRSFLGEIADLDPDGDDFGTELAIAVREAVVNNPKLRAAQAAAQPPSGGEFSGGPAGRTDPESLSVDDFRAQRRHAAQRSVRAGTAA
jgi:hypothetical protein